MILAGKYGVGEFPTLKFFPKTYKAGEGFDGGCDLDDFVIFINEKVGNMDDLVKEILSADENECEVFENLFDPYTNYDKDYLKTTKKTTEKGADYAKERTRQRNCFL